MSKKHQFNFLNASTKYIWKAISYVFIAILIGLNIWLVVMLNQTPTIDGQNIIANFNVYEAILTTTGITHIGVSNQGIAFYVISSVMSLVSLLYGIALYRLHKIKAMWSYFLIVTIFAISYVLTFILVNATGPNNYDLYLLVTQDDVTKVNPAKLNIFFEITKTTEGYKFNHIGSRWIYNVVEIVLFFVTLPVLLVFSVSRKVQPVQQYV